MEVKSMREILAEMKENFNKEPDKPTSYKPQKKNLTYKKIPNIQASVNAKSLTYSRQLKDINNMPIREEVETEPCKFCESDILKGREFCSDRCRGLYHVEN